MRLRQRITDSQPKQSSSRVHSSCISIAAGLIRPLELEKMMGAAAVLLEIECAKAGDDASLWLRDLMRAALDGLAGVWLFLPLQLWFRSRRGELELVLERIVFNLFDLGFVW